MSSSETHLTVRSVRWWAWSLLLGLGTLSLPALDCGAQSMPPIDNGAQRRIPQPRDPRSLEEQTQTGAALAFYEKRIQMLSAEQHRSMVADTDRLVKLVADLNAQINSSKASTLTPEQLRTIAEIEKLAHSVRDKMRMSVRSAVNNEDSDVPFAPR